MDKTEYSSYKPNLIRTILVRKQIPLVFEPLDIKAIAEIGTWRGVFFRQLIKPQSVEIAIAVDAWDASILASGGSTQVTQAECDAMLASIRKLALNSNRVKIGIGHGDSPKVAEKVEDQSLDFIYIDADHTYPGVVRDLAAWYPKLRDGGILSGHDYFEHKYYVKYGVVQAVNEFRESNNLSFFHVTKENCPSWFIIKGQ